MHERVDQDRIAIGQTLKWVRELIEHKLSHFSNGKTKSWRSLDMFCPIRDEYEKEVLSKIRQELVELSDLVACDAELAILRTRFTKTLTVHKPPENSSAIGHIYMLLSHHRAFTLLRMREQTSEKQ